MKTIKEIAESKILEYKTQYNNWSIENPSRVMHGNLSKIIGCEYAEHCDEITELDILIKVFKGKQGNATGANGFRWIVEAIEDVKEDYIKSNREDLDKMVQEVVDKINNDPEFRKWDGLYGWMGPKAVNLRKQKDENNRN